MPAFPPGWERTPAYRRKRAQFDADLTIAAAYHGIQAEARRAGGRDLRVDQDLRMRRDDPKVPLSNQRQPEDPGVVVYFTIGTRKVALACDRWDRVEHNMRAIAYTLEAKRAVTRWGCATADAEYAGYEALPPPGGTSAPSRPRRPAHEILHVSPNAPPEIVQAAFREQAKRLHPDVATGDHESFIELKDARDELLAAARRPA